MIERLQDGDRVMVLNLHHARHLRKRLADAGKKVDVEIYPNRLDDGRRSTGRTYFDHPLQCNWVEEAIMHAAQSMAREEDRLSAMPQSESREWPAITDWARDITR